MPRATDAQKPTDSESKRVASFFRRLLNEKGALKIVHLEGYEFIESEEGREFFSESLRSKVDSALKIIKNPDYSDQPVVAPFFDGSLFTGELDEPLSWKLRRVVRVNNVILAEVDFQSDGKSEATTSIFVLSAVAPMEIDDVCYTKRQGSLREHLSDAFRLRIGAGGSNPSDGSN